mmetsp:Transcript_23644/g.59345  ORF Transcript_23644/g.59345 Transcript_23644/m.59345 type:complete len:294 (-) Transcript_23644:186-1067(-)
MRRLQAQHCLCDGGVDPAGHGHCGCRFGRIRRHRPEALSSARRLLECAALGAYASSHHRRRLRRPDQLGLARPIPLPLLLRLWGRRRFVPSCRRRHWSPPASRLCSLSPAIPLRPIRRPRRRGRGTLALHRDPCPCFSLLFGMLVVALATLPVQVQAEHHSTRAGAALSTRRSSFPATIEGHGCRGRGARSACCDGRHPDGAGDRRLRQACRARLDSVSWPVCRLFACVRGGRGARNPCTDYRCSAPRPKHGRPGQGLRSTQAAYTAEVRKVLDLCAGFCAPVPPRHQQDQLV